VKQINRIARRRRPPWLPETYRKRGLIFGPLLLPVLPIIDGQVLRSPRGDRSKAVAVGTTSTLDMVKAPDEA